MIFIAAPWCLSVDDGRPKPYLERTVTNQKYRGKKDYVKNCYARVVAESNEILIFKPPLERFDSLSVP